MKAVEGNRTTTTVSTIGGACAGLFVVMLDQLGVDFSVETVALLIPSITFMVNYFIPVKKH